VSRSIDVAVVGAGPAGISAALSAAERGVSVALFDEAPTPGGHLRWTLGIPAELPEPIGGKRGFEIAAWAAGRVAESPVEFVPDAAVWGLFEPRLLTVVAGAMSYEVRCGAIVVATGSTDITLPFPGWQLPGVMTATAFLRLVNLYRVAPGRRIGVIGAGSDAAEVIGSAEAASMAVVGRSDATTNISAHGSDRVESLVVAGSSIEVDAVVIALGRQPGPELSLQALAETHFSSLAGAHVPTRSATLESSLPGVFVAGEAGDNCSVAEAFAEGRLAGLAASGASDLDEAMAAIATLRAVSVARRETDDGKDGARE
jgi:thioredoxin reductase